MGQQRKRLAAMVIGDGAKLSSHRITPKWSLMQVVDAAIVFGQTEICDVGYGLTRIDRACA
jgi:hypothetical protein